jgi:hypothetical protein
MSAFSKKYWLAKGYSEEEAIYQISIRRPNNINYYINKGHTLEEATKLVKERQSKGGVVRANLSKEDKKKLTPRCVEFWLAKGQTLEEARESLAQHQTMFSKEKCIEKYGEEQGLLIWAERQQKWQETLNNKSDEEKKIINSKKNHWANKTEEEANIVKNKTVSSLKQYYDSMSVDEKRELGKSISERMIKFGYATPIEERDAFEEYRNKVYSESKRYDLTSLENFDKRGPLSYHIDHKYSVFQGFKEGVSHEIIGHICNLEMLTYDQNTSKRSNCSITLENLLGDIRKYNDSN